jgi:hypothetical protein
LDFGTAHMAQFRKEVEARWSRRPTDFDEIGC